MGSEHNKLEADCKRVLQQFGWFTWKNLQNTYKRAVPAEVKGTPDRFAMKHGVWIALEFKTGSDHQRPEQILFQREFESHGGKYYLIRSVDDLLNGPLNNSIGEKNDRV